MKGVAGTLLGCQKDSGNNQSHSARIRESEGHVSEGLSGPLCLMWPNVAGVSVSPAILGIGHGSFARIGTGPFFDTKMDIQASLA